MMNLTLTLYNESGKACLIFAFDSQWKTIEEGKAWAEQILRLTPKRQCDRFDTFVDGAVIEDADSVIWHCHQTGSPVAVIDCDYSRKMREYQKSREAAPGEVHLHVRI